MVDELPRGITKDGESRLSQELVTLALVAQGLRRDDVDEVGVIDTQSGGDAGQGSELRLEEDGPRKLSVDDEGAGEGLIWRAGKLRGVVYYGADNTAIAHSAHAGEFFGEVCLAHTGAQRRVCGDEAIAEAVVAGDVNDRAGLGNATDAVYEDRFRKGSFAVDALGVAAILVGKRIGGKGHFYLFLGRGDDTQAMHSSSGLGDEHCGVGAAGGGDGAQAQLGRKIEAVVVITPYCDARCQFEVGAVFQVGPKGGVIDADGVDIGQWCCHASKEKARCRPVRASGGRGCG